ncbi:DHRS1 [Lepeophtheirus salmonis]|uniref:DHRS1 n=1 Tax=Lepeophtheirus salmonis TaxID=72036 RepID=A0A7R8H0T2_LEPSM|nr:DHRS1 [Lepeophtheirus salmonis]CAF2795491.1 DHRS1 [Lepeophtheirus salmonis]
MDLVIKVTNIIRGGKGSVCHQRIITFWNEVDTEYGDSQLHMDIKWMSRIKYLERFYGLRSDILVFLENTQTRAVHRKIFFPSCAEIRKESLECEEQIQNTKQTLKSYRNNSRIVSKNSTRWNRKLPYSPSLLWSVHSHRTCRSNFASYRQTLYLKCNKTGATIYITGRSKNDLEKTASEIKKRGGSPIPVQLDHNNDLAVEQFFERVKNEQNGQLDLLVNNAYSGAEIINECMGKSFYESPTPDLWDKINGVGLRNHYLCTVYASRIMVENKTACDRMAADCAVELRNKNVTMVSIWPGPVKTEEITNRVLENSKALDGMKRIFETGESTEFTGMAIVKLASDPCKIQCTGKVLLTSCLAREYGITDLNGTITGDIKMKDEDERSVVLGKSEGEIEQEEEADDKMTDKDTNQHRGIKRRLSTCQTEDEDHSVDSNILIIPMETENEINYNRIISIDLAYAFPSDISLEKIKWDNL